MIQQISTKQAIINLSEDLDIPLSNLATLMKWTIECEKGIHSWNSKIYSVELYNIVNSSILLPEYVVKIENIFPGDQTKDFLSLFGSDRVVFPVVDDITEMVWSSLDCYGSNLDEYFWNYLDGAINFPSNVTDQNVTIIHQVLTTNEEGFLIVNDTHIKPIRLFLELKLLKRKAFQKSFTGKYDNGFANYMRDIDMEYHRSIANARALDGRERRNIKLSNDVSGLQIFVNNDNNLLTN